MTISMLFDLDLKAIFIALHIIIRIHDGKIMLPMLNCNKNMFMYVYNTIQFANFCHICQMTYILFVSE